MNQCAGQLKFERDKLRLPSCLLEKLYSLAYFLHCLKMDIKIGLNRQNTILDHKWRFKRLLRRVFP